MKAKKIYFCKNKKIKNMKKILTFLFLVTSFNVFAQQVEKPVRTYDTGFRPKSTIVSLGYGGPNIAPLLYKFDGSVSKLSATIVGPAYIKFEYGLGRYFGLGFNLAASKTEIKWVKEELKQISGSSSYYVYNDTKVSRNALSGLLRLNGHFAPGKKLDPYLGVGLGFRTITYTDATNEQAIKDAKDFHKNFDAKYLIVGGEFTFGLRFYFTKNIAAYAEFGLAKTPMQGGLSVAF
jgi:opacity protein-like surface antigen